MVSDKLRRLFLISIPLFMAHGVEEFITRLYSFDQFYVNFGSNAKNVYVLSQITMVLLLLISYRYLLNKKFGFTLSIFWGFVLLYELEHVYRAITLKMYTPGLWTSLPLIVIGILFCKEIFSRHDAY